MAGSGALRCSRVGRMCYYIPRLLMLPLIQLAVWKTPETDRHDGVVRGGWKRKQSERERERVTTLERLEGTNKGFFLVAILIDKHCSPRSVSAFTMLFNNYFFLSFSLLLKDYGGRSRPLEKWENMLQKRLRKEKRCCTKRKNKGGVGKLE